MKTPPRTLGEILGLRGWEPNILDRWRLARDDDRVRVAVEKLDSLWQTWSPEQRLLLLRTVEQIAYARRATKAWKSGNLDTIQRYKRLAREGLRAAWLAQSIIDRCPPPWSEGQAAIQDFVMQLVEFVTCSLHETSNADHYVATHVAALMLTDLRSRPDSTPTLELISELLWLAEGMKTENPDRRSIILRLSTKGLTKTQVARD